MKLLTWTTLAALTITTPLFAQNAGFKDTAGKHLDILRDGKPIVRYQYEYNPEKRLETYKPMHHVMDAEGKDTITKGHGGQFTHHRAIYIGWNRLGHQGKNYDLWHMKGEAAQGPFVFRGSEHYAFDGDLIAEIRQYWTFDRGATATGLQGYPYDT